MKLEITREVFKAQAQKQLAALRERNIELKLSDIQESLAQAYGHANLATLYASFKKEEFSEVDAKPFLAQEENQFVITWIPDPENEMLGDDVIAIMPPGTRLEQFHARNLSYAQMDELLAKAVLIPEGLVFSEETIALENYAWVPEVDRYGYPDSANSATVKEWVKEWLGFRVPKSGVEVGVYDLGDDSGSRDHFLIWLNDEDSAKVRALFAQK
jgi:hypothetical protein